MSHTESDPNKAAVSVEILKTVGPKESFTQTHEEKSMSKDVFGLRTSEDVPEAEVSISVTAQVSEKVIYDTGTWDFIPFKVEVTASVSVKCDQDPDQITAAQEVAKEMALDNVFETSKEALASHIMNIRENLFPGKFG